MHERGKLGLGTRTKAVPFQSHSYSSPWKEEERKRSVYPTPKQERTQEAQWTLSFPFYPFKRLNQSVDERTLLKIPWMYFDYGLAHFISPKNRCEIFSPPTRVSQRVTLNIFSGTKRSEWNGWCNRCLWHWVRIVSLKTHTICSGTWGISISWCLHLFGGEGRESTKTLPPPNKAEGKIQWMVWMCLYLRPKGHEA